jgi:hypothetical protein
MCNLVSHIDLRDSYILRMFENSVARRIFKYIRKDEMSGACSMHGEIGKCTQHFGPRKPQTEKPTWETETYMRG